MEDTIDIPKISKPANRAFAEAGYTDLRQFTAVEKTDLLALHGFGPKGIRIVEEAMAKHGLAFKE